ncbi:MAG: class I SAM-dependent methyltransferase [Acidobacteria bacterium]|nr:class I SAM-dependent methyltransferase [Acidobacteriota bacterium]
MARHVPSRLGDRLRRLAEEAGVALDEPRAERLAEYVELLRRWNAKLNLTRLDRDDAGLARLAIEPLVALPYLPRQGTLVDIGSGGGSPAIPVKLALPGLGLRMVEARTRKAVFLRETVRHLGLDRTEVVAERYEALLSRRELQKAHGALTVRGVRLSREALRRLQAFVAPGGALLLFRGPEPADAWSDASPALEREASVPLRGAPGSRLVVLRRREG